jgi:hypothetical protein
MKLFSSKPNPVEPSPMSDQQLADPLKEAAQYTATVAGDLARRRWRVSVTIFPHSSDGASSTVDVSRIQRLAGE